MGLLKTIRLELGLSQEDFARKLKRGLSRSTYAAWEAGNNEAPAWAYVKAISLWPKGWKAAWPLLRREFLRGQQ